MAGNDLFSAISSGINNVTNAVGGEAQKMGQRTVKNVTQDFNEVADGIKKGGILGGAGATVDVLSPGHQIVEAGDDLGVLPSDPNMKQAIAAGINGGIGAALVATGNPFGLMLVANGIAEGVDGVGGMMKSGQVQAPATTQAPMAPSQGNIQPGAAYDDAKARALTEAKAKARELTNEYNQGYLAGERAQAARDRGMTGFVQPNYGMPSYGGPSYTGPNGGYGEPSYGGGNGNIGDVVGQQGSDLQQILNDPNMSFEDKVFAILEAVMQDAQKKVEGDEKALVGPDAPKDDASRQKAVEDLKNDMNKLQEMQQALDGILSSMHETSMNTIRNIK